MKLHKYNQFLGEKPLNENLDKSKKFLKDRFLLKTAAQELGLIKGELAAQLEHGEKKTLTLKDFSEEQQQELRLKLRELRLSDEQVRSIERDPEFVKLRELIKDNIGYLYNFVYMYYVEMVPFNEIESMYNRVLEYRALLDKLPKKFDVNFIDTNIKNNAEVLEDGLDSLKDYRRVKKIIDTLPSKLKAEYNSATHLQKEQMAQIASGFENPDLSEEKRQTIWRTFFGEMKIDNRPNLPNGKPNPNFNKSVYSSSLRRFENMDQPLKEFIKAAQSHLASAQNEGYTARIERINECNARLGTLGVTVPFEYNDKGILIIEVKSFQANQMLNGHTRHCIKDSIHQWNSYVASHNNKQYYIYNFNISQFDNLSTIGVTIQPGQSIRAAHAKNDSGVSGELRSIFKTWERQYGIKEDLFSCLKSMTREEIEKRERAKIAEREIVRKGLTIEQIKGYVKDDGADINKDQCKALDNAVEEGDIEKVKTILELGGNPNLKENPLHAPISKATNFDMIKLLVSYGSNMTGDVFTNILHDNEALEYCLKAGLDPNFGQSLPFRRVCKGSWVDENHMGESYLDAFKMLLKYGGTIVEKTQNGKVRNMIIKWASEYARIDILDYLKDIGVSKTFSDDDWTEALRWLAHARKINNKDKEKLRVYLVEQIKDKSLINNKTRSGEDLTKPYGWLRTEDERAKAKG